MIRFAEKRDKSALLALYDSCFPGEPAFSAWFFDTVWRPENTLVHDEAGLIVAALQMLPLTLADGLGRSVRASYLYAIGTYPSARGQGLMSALITHSLGVGRERGQSLSVLLTQNDELFDFYVRFGFYPFFYIRSRPLEPCPLPSAQIARPMEACDYAAVNALYEQAVRGTLHAERDSTHFARLLDMYGSGACVLADADGVRAYCFGSVQDGVYTADEALGPGADALAAHAAHESGAQSAVLRLLPGDGTGAVRAGCVRPLDNTAIALLKELGPFSYLNLMFN